MQVRTLPSRLSVESVDRSIRSGTEALLQRQRSDGHWVFELEADVTIPAEYVLMRHYLGEPIDAGLEAKLGRYIRRVQGAHGGWPLFEGGALDISATVKAYFALKMIGDSVDASHMRRARAALLERGGAAGCNVFTRALLALFGIVSWRAVPLMPVEIMLLPPWFPIHIDKISYWARTVVVPLLVLGALKPLARNPRGIGISELFSKDPRSLGMAEKAAHQNLAWYRLFRGVDQVLRGVEPVSSKRLRERAIAAAASFVKKRLNDENGLGAIFPAMVNAVLMLDALGTPRDHPDYVAARGAIDKLLVVKSEEAYCQPCVSPVWDTALSCHTLLETGDLRAAQGARAGLDWLLPRQVLDQPGDWCVRRPNVRPGGWAFQYDNAFYPDVDDTAVVVMAMDRARSLPGAPSYRIAIERGRDWVLGMQSTDGGWGAFDADNDYRYLNNIPFADHGALLDPPTEDVTGRCVSMLAQLGRETAQSPELRRGVSFLIRTQRPDGSWYGRWGMNYIYGTWSALCALAMSGLHPDCDTVRRAADWLEGIQNPDGGWGEDGASYKLDYAGHEPAPSTASQTAWALLGLMAAGRADGPAVGRGIEFLVRTQAGDGFWEEPRFTATGFPRVFYLRYHGYPKYFPLWALARFRNLRAGRAQLLGM